MRVRQGLVMLCAAASIAVAMVASAADSDAPGSVDIEAAMSAGEILPLADIIQRAKAQFPGRITEIELGYSEGRYLYEVDVLDDSGVKRELLLDAKTAELLATKVDDDDEGEAAEGEGGDEGAAPAAEGDDGDEDTAPAAENDDDDSDSNEVAKADCNDK